MAMPRPSGKAQKIAEAVIPGLSRSGKSKSLSKRSVKEVPNDEVEMKIVDINEHLGRLPHEKKKTRI